MKLVRMKVHTNGLNPGEVAAFDDELAEALVRSGRAELARAPEPKDVNPEAKLAGHVVDKGGGARR